MAETEAKKDQIYAENAVCEQCGCYGAYEFAGATLCGSCYESCGSCCPEFKPDGDNDE